MYTFECKDVVCWGDACIGNNIVNAASRWKVGGSFEEIKLIFPTCHVALDEFRPAADLVHDKRLEYDWFCTSPAQTQA